MSVRVIVGRRTIVSPCVEFSPWGGELFVHQGDWEQRQAIAAWKGTHWEDAHGREFYFDAWMKPDQEGLELRLIAADGSYLSPLATVEGFRLHGLRAPDVVDLSLLDSDEPVARGRGSQWLLTRSDVEIPRLIVVAEPHVAPLDADLISAPRPRPSALAAG